ncbi:HAD family hydrolase [Gilvimarinus sp. F26214L]|uniref:HAD family hydrolase n=1 Tax=Gilvimarinus sp. DZF01 TaxID=3461371 RepID=UPI0040464546
MTLKAVIFDLDGTLLDTAPDFFTTVNQLRQEEGLPPLPNDIIRRTVSNGARALVNMAFELEFTAPGFDRLHQRLLQIYAEQLAASTQPFPGIPETLALLQSHSIPWGIVTNKSHTYTRPILDALDLHPDPATVICPEDVENTKPHPESLLLACDQLSCQAREVIYVGDHQRDIDCGKAAGSYTVAAAYGYVADGIDPTHWQADHLIHSAYELLDIIPHYLEI